MNEEINKLEDNNKWKELLLSMDFKDIDDFFQEEHSVYGDELSIYPPPEDIFTAFKLTPIQDIKVVILGQDPYHNKGEAMGLCFSVPNNIKVPPSLLNIYKELKNDLDNDNFEIPKHGNLINWAKQGVFLLNASLTVRENSPNSHSKIWKDKTSKIIEYISEYTENTIFILWGSFAKSKKPLIDTNKHYILECNHPSPLSANRGGWFGNKHFSQVNELLRKHNKTEINWSL